ncbi:Histidine kinase [Flavobacterium fontis]|uniref:histidine kinase n=2 Tax=Flavobacterium fontis TaxID=1124188 RepID=A0A1M5CWD4_9FLAO|nr:Histidine kinase [Flavobacterium fontis]
MCHRGQVKKIIKVLGWLCITLGPFLHFGQTRKYIDSLNHLSFEQKIKNPKQLLPYYKSAIQKAQNINYAKGQWEAYANASLLYYYLGKYDLELQYARVALKGFEQENNLDYQAYLWGEIGYRMKRRNLKEAERYMQKGIRLAETHQLKQPLMALYDNYGVLKEMQRQWDSAHFFYTQGLTLKSKFRDRSGIPYSLNNLGGLYLLQKKWDKAQPYFEKAIAIRQSMGDTVGLCESYLTLSDLYLQQQQMSKAKRLLDWVVKIASQKQLLQLAQSAYMQRASWFERNQMGMASAQDLQQAIAYQQRLAQKETRDKVAELEIFYQTQEKEKELLEQRIVIQERNTWLLLASVLLGAMGLIGFLIYRQQQLKNRAQQQAFALEKAIAKIETQNQLHDQRLAISRDLHDNIGAQLTFIISSVETLKFGFSLTDSLLLHQLDKIATFSKITIRELRDTIWAMNQEHISMHDLKARLVNFIEQAKQTSDSIAFNFNFLESNSTLVFSALTGVNLYRIIQEALHNAIKYAQATEIHVVTTLDNQRLHVEIRDNGKGFDLENVNFGNGLHNMRKRMEEIGGNLEIKTLTNHGTQILLQLPV